MKHETSLPRRALLGAALAVPAVARAQSAWPDRPVKILVPFPPGGSNDTIARPLAEVLTRRLGHPFVVENRGGAAGAIGAQAVAQAAADGTTLMVHSSSFATSAVLQKTPYDAEASFDAVTTLARAPFFILVHPSFPARNIAELVAEAKKRPGGIDYASSGTGGINHFTTEDFCLRAGIRLNMVPYRGTAAAVTDLVAGHVQVMNTSVASANAAIREGRVRVIAATDENAELPPGVPPVTSVKAQGIDYDFRIWWGLFAPRGLAEPLRRRILAEATEALKDQNLARIYDAEGARPEASADGVFARVLHEDLARWRQVKQAASISAE